MFSRLPLLLLLLTSLLGCHTALAQTSFQSLNYLYSISGAQTVAGQHNREPNATPAVQTNRIFTTTGRYPGLWSGDFLFASSDVANRWAMINEAKAQWASGAIINLMWHACPPTQPEPCQWAGGVQSTLSNTQWQELITDGTQLNNNWKARLDIVAGYLQDLENNGVEVLFRPLHEMNQGAFWWGGRPGPNGTARLFQLTHDYLTTTKGLSNLVWVWDVQDFSTLSSDLTTYNPGGNYWDVLALDMYYSDGQGYTTAKYNAIVNAAGSKPVAIGECEVLPSASLLALQPRWSFFMGWAELVFNQNSTANIQALYTASNVVTRDEMPGWNTLPVAPNLAYNRPIIASTTEDSTHTAAKAVDANGNTRWSSAYADNQHLTVDLGANYTVNRVRLAWEAAYARNYQVQISTDNATWTTVQNVVGKTSAAADDYTGFSAPARYVRVNCLTRATVYGFSLFELEVYGTTILSSSRPQQLISLFPNPATDQVFIQLPTNWQSDTEFSVRDLYGRILHKGLAKGPVSSFSVSSFPSGIYYVEITHGHDRVVQKLTKR